MRPRSVGAARLAQEFGADFVFAVGVLAAAPDEGLEQDGQWLAALLGQDKEHANLGTALEGTVRDEANAGARNIDDLAMMFGWLSAAGAMGP